MTPPRTVANCRCRCHAYGPGTHGTCDLEHDTGSTGVPGVPSCSPHKADVPTSDATTVVVSPVRWVIRDLDYLLEHVGDLATSKQPGTPRPWSTPMLSPEVREQRDRLDRIERDERERDVRGVVMGFTRAPVHVDVLDAQVDVAMTAWEISDALVRFVPAVETRIQSVFADPSPLLNHLRWMLPIADEYDAANDYEAGLVWWVQDHTRRLCDMLDRQLGLIRPGTLLTALCPFCRGVDPEHPAGGHLTLQVREIAKARPKTATRPEVLAAFAVVCGNRACAPPEGKVGTWYRGQPAWRQDEWEWLAPMLLPVEEAGRTTSTSGWLTELPTHGAEIEGFRFDAHSRRWIDDVAGTIRLAHSRAGRYLTEHWERA